MSQKKTQPRIWTVTLGDDFDAFRQEAQQAMLEIEAIGARLGGKFYAEPHREQGDDGLWYTTSWTIAWDSFVPGKRSAPAKAKPKPEPVPDAEEERSVRMRHPEGVDDILVRPSEVEGLMEGGYFEVPAEEKVAA